MKSTKKIEKNLANCTPREFLRQTGKIKKSVEKWLTATDILNLRKQVPKYNDDMTKEERDNATAEQVKTNLSRILDAILVDHPDETLELLGLLCFIEPKDVDNYQISEYLNNFAEIIGDEAVLNFFISLGRWGQTNIFR